MKHQLHLTILLPVAIDYRQRVRMKPIADLIATLQTAIGQHHTAREGYSPLYSGGQKVFMSLAGRGEASLVRVGCAAIG